MRVSLDLTADALARLTAEAARRNLELGAVIDELAASSDLTIEQIIEGTEPMGDLGELLIDDLTEEDEDQFFGILEDL